MREVIESLFEHVKDGQVNIEPWIIELRAHAEAQERKRIQIRFDGPPGPVAGRFIEVEDADSGRSIRFGEWKQDGNDWLLIASIPDEQRIVQETERRVRDEMGATVIATIEAFKPKPSGRIDTGELWRGATVVNIRDAVLAAIKGAKS